jgi:positive regulator of sigma E activity
MTLGQALTRHRAQCGDCTADHACGQYLAIAREHTAARQIWSGPVAACTVLSVREGEAT